MVRCALVFGQLALPPAHWSHASSKRIPVSSPPFLAAAAAVKEEEEGEEYEKEEEEEEEGSGCYLCVGPDEISRLSRELFKRQDYESSFSVCRWRA